mgnify:CR=1 FL=1
MLEPGVGRGEFLNNLKDLGLDVVGVDISPEAVEYENNLDVRLCDVANFPLPFEEKQQKPSSTAHVLLG